MRFFHTSDLHIGASQPEGGRDRHTELVFRALREMAECAINEGIEFIVIAGDVFDSNYVEASLVDRFLSLLGDFSEVRFILIPGGGYQHKGEISGHDAYTRDSVYRRFSVSKKLSELSNVKLLTPDDPFWLDEESSTAFYAGFFEVPRTSPLSGARFHIAVAHGAFGDKDYEVRIGDNPYHYIALGHYHASKQVAENAWYSGALVQFEFLPYRDAVSGWLEVRLGEGRVEVERKELEGYPSYVKMRLESTENLDRLKEHLEKDHVYVKVVSYMEEFENTLLELSGKYQGRLVVDDTGKIPSGVDSKVIAALENALKDVDRELRDEVFALLSFLVTSEMSKADMEKFLIGRCIHD